MAVKIKLQRLGKIRNAQYRVVIANARTRRDGKVIENIGIYHPKENPSVIRINSERVQYWLSVGAQPTEPVLALLKITGDWQKFKGLPGSEGRLQVAEPKPSKLELFNQALAEANEGPTAEAVTEKKRKAKDEAAAKKAAEEAKAAKADEAAADSSEAAASEAAE